MSAVQDHVAQAANAVNAGALVVESVRPRWSAWYRCGGRWRGVRGGRCERGGELVCGSGVSGRGGGFRDRLGLGDEVDAVVGAAA